MTLAKERVFDIINRMSEEQVTYLLQYLEKAEGLPSKKSDMASKNISMNKSLGRSPGPLAGGLVFMADDFDETPDCFKEYM